MKPNNWKNEKLFVDFYLPRSVRKRISESTPQSSHLKIQEHRGPHRVNPIDETPCCWQDQHGREGPWAEARLRQNQEDASEDGIELTQSEPRTTAQPVTARRKQRQKSSRYTFRHGMQSGPTRFSKGCGSTKMYSVRDLFEGKFLLLVSFLFCSRRRTRQRPCHATERNTSDFVGYSSHYL